MGRGIIMEYTLKLAIVGACLLCLASGIAIGHLSTYFTLRSMRNREEYLFNLRMQHETDTIRILTESANGPGVPGSEGTWALYPSRQQPAAPPTSPAHRRPSPSLLARQRETRLHEGAPTPNHKTLLWDTLLPQPISKG